MNSNYKAFKTEFTCKINLDINIYKALHFAIFNDGEDHDENHDKSL